MDVDALRPGLKVKTTQLGETKGMLVKPKHLLCRQAGITGEALQYVPGHGGDVWFVKHDGSDDVGAYCFTELEPA